MPATRKILGTRPLRLFVLAATVLALVALPACIQRKPTTTNPTGQGGVPPGGPGNPQLPAEYVLRVITEPPGASVFVDSKDIGPAPIDALTLPNVRHAVRIVRGDMSIEHVLEQVEVPVCAIFAHMTPGVDGFADYRISSAQPDTDVYLGLTHLGRAPMQLILGMPADESRWLTVGAPGGTPEREQVHGYHANWVSLRPIRFEMTATETAPGPVPTPASLAVPTLSWTDPHRGVLNGEITRVFAGSQGQVALVVEHGQDETIFYVSAESGVGTATATPLASWRTKAIAVNQRSFPIDQPVLLAGWAGSRLLFVVPELQPDGQSPGTLGTALWQADVSTGELRRLSWWHSWAIGVRVQDAWVTTDGRSAVVHMLDIGAAISGRDEGGSQFRVLDLASGAERVITASPPYYEPAGCAAALVSPDGWHVAWSVSTFSPGPGDVTVLDLRSGKKSIVLRTADGQLGGLQWSPDASMLAVGYAGKDEQRWKVYSDDAGALYPARFVLVSPTGQRISELAVPGEILGSRIAWSPQSDRIAVTTIEPVPGTESPDPSSYGSAHSRKVYAGPVGGPLKLVWDPAAVGEEEARSYHTCAFLGDGGFVISTYADNQDCRVLLMDVANDGLSRGPLEGLGLCTLYDRLGGEQSNRADAILVASRVGQFLLTEDGELIQLVTAPNRYPYYPYGTHWDGDYLVIGRTVFRTDLLLRRQS